MAAELAAGLRVEGAALEEELRLSEQHTSELMLLHATKEFEMERALVQAEEQMEELRAQPEQGRTDSQRLGAMKVRGACGGC